jgi:hypothetical protein
MQRHDLEQRFQILELLEKQVVFLENQELSSAFSKFRSENSQWVLTEIQNLLEELQNVLELEDLNTNWY